MNVEWTIDGYPVPLQWSDVTMTAPGGFGNLGQAVLPQKALPLTADVFSVVVGTRADGVPLYVGELAGPPHLVRGTAYLQVQGMQARIMRKRGRRLYQSQDITKFVTAQSDPHRGGNFFVSTGDDKFGISVADGAIIFSRPPEAFTTGDENGVIFWAPNQTIVRVAFKYAISGALTSFQLRIHSGTGPTGSLTVDSPTYTLSGTTSVDHTLTTPADMVAITIHAAANITPTSSQQVVIHELRINDARVGLTDSFDLSDLSANIADEFEWDDLATPNAFTALPADWENDWTSGLSEVTARCSCMWLVLPPVTENADAGIYIGDWGRHTWTARGVDLSDLVPQVRFNKAVVAYNSPAGVQLEVVADADPDPYVGRGLEVAWPPGGPFVLADGQYSSTVAEAAAMMLIEYWSQPRVSGQVEIGRVWDDGGEAHPWDIDAGDLIELPELELLGEPLPPQRVVEVTKHVNGTATVSVSEATSMGALLADLEPLSTTPTPESGPYVPRERRRRRRRHRGGRHNRGGTGKWKPDWKPGT